MKKTISFGPHGKISYGFIGAVKDPALFLEVSLTYHEDTGRENKVIRFDDISTKKHLAIALRIIAGEVSYENVLIVYRNGMFSALESGKKIDQKETPSYFEIYFADFVQTDIWDLIKGFQYHELIPA